MKPQWMIENDRTEQRILTIQETNRRRLATLPPPYLRMVALPLWSNYERERYQPANHVWDRDRQRWVRG